METCLSASQTAVRRRGSDKCLRHECKEILLYCRDCDELGCVECSLKLHKNHEEEELSDIHSEVKQRLVRFIDDLQTTKIPQLQQEIHMIGQNISKNKYHYNDIVKRLEKQNETLKAELDKITNNFTNICQAMERQNAEVLQNCQTQLQVRLDEQAYQLQECKSALEIGTIIQVFDLCKYNVSKLDLPVKPNLYKTEITEGKYKVKQLEHLVVEKFTSEGRQPPSINWEETSQFEIPDYCMSPMHAGPDDHVWVRLNKELLLVDATGNTVDTIQTKVYPKNFCLSPSTDNIWFYSHEDNHVREIISDKSLVKFKTNDKARSICITVDGHVVIGFDSKVIKFTPYGREICQTSSEVMKYPCNISECPETKNLAVIDRDLKKFGGENKAHVSILSRDLKLLFCYHGEDLNVEGQFDPWDLCYTSTGELVIAENKSLLMVSGQAQYLQTLYKEFEYDPDRICVQNDGSLWVAFSNGTVKIFNPC